MALPAYMVRRSFIRSVYRNAAAATEDSRNDYLDDLADAAQLDLQAGGQLQSSSAGGVSAGFDTSRGLRPADRLELYEWARDYIGEATVAEAIALIKPGTSAVATDFSGVRG